MDGLAQTSASASAQGEPAEAPRVAPPIEVLSPSERRVPLVFASPHSGDVYPPAFVRAARLDAQTLRRSEDAHVHHLFADAPAVGAPLLRATFPRAFLDPNREPYELDPTMFDGPLPSHANTRSPRVLAGLGTIPRMVASGHDIYRHRLPVGEAEARVNAYYRPYHAALRRLIDETVALFGCCLVVDCHSMPSGLTGVAGASVPDFVLGDNHGISCDRAAPTAVEAALAVHGYTVTRNMPYAGGYTTRHYGRPESGVHTLQIEINRRLYMDERSYARLPGFDTLRRHLAEVIDALAAVPPERLKPR
jgi:N-formylglutamate amidohydrolase